MSEQVARNRFIPFRKSDIVDMCLADSGLPATDHEAFREFCRILESIIHFEFHHLLGSLKDAYAPFNPDTDVRPLRTYTGAEKQALQKRLVECGVGDVRDLLTFLSAADTRFVSSPSPHRRARGTAPSLPSTTTPMTGWETASPHRARTGSDQAN